MVDGRESKVLCCLKKKVLEKKEKKKNFDRIRFVRIMEARRKEPLFLRQQQGRKSMVEARMENSDRFKVGSRNRRNGRTDDVFRRKSVGKRMKAKESL